MTRLGDTVKFKGARDLAKFLASSEEVHGAFAEHLFQHLIKQPVRAYGAKQADELRESFSKNDFSIRKLTVEIMARAALTGPQAGKPSE